MVKAAYSKFGPDKEQPVEKISLHVCWLLNSTFVINSVVPTGTNPAAGPQYPDALVAIEIG